MADPASAGEVFNKSRALLNDTGLDTGGVPNLFTDDVLLPYLQMAIVDLLMDCEDNNIPVTNITSPAITVPAGTKVIGTGTSIALPRDLIEIVEMYERIAGSGNDFMLMKRRTFEPKTDVETTYLQVYTWQGQQVHFIGATSDIEIKIDYISQTSESVTDKNSLILIYNSRAFLWFRTAALAAFYVMQNKTRSDECNSEGLRCLEVMESIGIKSQQNMPIRRRPFMSAYRQRGWMGYGR